MVDLNALRTELQTDPNGLGYAPHLTNGNDGALAGLLNDKTKGETKIQRRLISARGILAEYKTDPMDAANVLDKLEQATAVNNVVKWAFGFLKGDGLDIGSPATQAMLGQLGQMGVITATEAANLQALGKVPASRAEVLFGQAVSDLDIRRAIWNDDGTRAI